MSAKLRTPFRALGAFVVLLYSVVTGRSRGRFADYPDSPLYGIELAKEQYALGKITFDQLSEKIDRDIRGLPEPVIAPLALEPPPPPKPVDKYAELRAKLLQETLDYQRRNAK